MHSTNADKIIDAAVVLFRQKNFYDVSVSEICKAAKVSRSVFYGTFPDKKAILLRLLTLAARDTDDLLQEIITAPNDFERIWSLSLRYIRLAEYLGPVLAGTALCMELQEPFGIMERVNAHNEWLATLMRNAQANGVIRCRLQPETMIPIINSLMMQTLFEWCCCGGTFSLQSRARGYQEVILDVAPECRTVATDEKEQNRTSGN